MKRKSTRSARLDSSSEQSTVVRSCQGHSRKELASVTTSLQTKTTVVPMLLVHLRSRKEAGMLRLHMRQSMLIVMSMRQMSDSTRLVEKILRTKEGMTVATYRRWLTSVRHLRKRVAVTTIRSRERMVTSLRRKRTSRKTSSKWSIVSAGKPMTSLRISSSSKNQSRE